MKPEVEKVMPTASDVWRWRDKWHRRCNDNDISGKMRHHIAVCDALESLARDLESRGDLMPSGPSFTGRAFDFEKLAGSK